MSDANINATAAVAAPAGDIAPVTATSAGALIVAMHGGGAGLPEVPKPFAQPIYLVPDARVAGTTHVADIAKLAEHLSEGDRLRFERDKANRYDKWAIRVLDGSGNRLGFVPADINQIPARLMDGGKCLFGQVTGIELCGSWWKIGMGVWLDD